MRDAEHDKHLARVYLTEARSRRNGAINSNFYWTLLRWAANARRRAARLPEPAPPPPSPAQLELFA